MTFSDAEPGGTDDAPLADQPGPSQPPSDQDEQPGSLAGEDPTQTSEGGPYQRDPDATDEAP